MELGIVEFILNQKEYRLAIVESDDDVPNDIEYFMFKSDVKNLEKGLEKAGKETIDEKLFQFAIEKNVIRRKKL